MEAIAKAKYIRTAPRKMRLVADMIRGKKVDNAEKILFFTPKRAAKVLGKVLTAAIHNAENNELDKDNLVVSRIYVDQGPSLKRWSARAMGRAVMVKKRTCHLTIILKEREEE